MSDFENIRKFEYRLSRLPATLQVAFNVEGETVQGLCMDVSDAGMRARFEGPVAVGSSGLITLQHPAALLKLQARVAYVENNEAGLEFSYDTPSEREETTKF